MSVATVKEVQELDVSLLFQHPSWLNNPAELDLLSLKRSAAFSKGQLRSQKVSCFLKGHYDASQEDKL